MAEPVAPVEVITCAATVGLPRESSTSLALICFISDIYLAPVTMPILSVYQLTLKPQAKLSSRPVARRLDHRSMLYRDRDASP